MLLQLMVSFVMLLHIIITMKACFQSQKNFLFLKMVRVMRTRAAKADIYNNK